MCLYVQAYVQYMCTFVYCSHLLTLLSLSCWSSVCSTSIQSSYNSQHKTPPGSFRKNSYARNWIKNEKANDYIFQHAVGHSVFSNHWTYKKLTSVDKEQSVWNFIQSVSLCCWKDCVLTVIRDAETNTDCSCIGILCPEFILSFRILQFLAFAERLKIPQVSGPSQNSK